MMRSVRIRGAAAAAVALLSLTVCGATALAASGPTTDAMTERPLAVFRVPSVSGALAAVREARIGQHVRNDPVLSSLADMQRAGVRLIAGLMTDMDQQALQRIAAREAAIVVFESDKPAKDAPPVGIVIHLGEDAELVKADFDTQFLPKVRASEPDLQVLRKAAPGGEIIHFRNGPKVGYLRFVGDLLVAGPEEVVAKFGPGGSTPAWAQADPAPGGIASTYMNLAPLWDMGMAADPGGAEGLRQSGLQAITEVFARTEAVAGGFSDTIVARLDSRAGGLLSALMALEPGATGAARVLPAEYNLLASVQVESGEKLYELIEAITVEQGGDRALNNLRAGRDQVDQAFAINVEYELLPAIGHEVFFAARTPDLDAVLSGRRLAWADFAPLFGFQVRDAEGLESMLQRFAASPVAAQQGWRLIADAHEGVRIQTLTSVAVPVRLSLACVEGYCVCATDIELVREAIDAAKGGATLATDERYAAVAARLPEQQRAGVYVDTKPLQDLLTEAIRQNAREKAQAFMPILQRAMPDLGGYGLTFGGGQGELRIEAYGDVPVLYGALTVAALGGSAASQVQKAGQVGPAAAAPTDDLGAFLEE